MEKKIFEILEKMKLEIITLDEAQKQLCVLFGVIQRSEQSICVGCNCNVKIYKDGMCKACWEWLNE